MKVVGGYVLQKVPLIRATPQDYDPADAKIDNFFMVPLVPIRGCTDFASCNHNPKASEDDGSCRYGVGGGQYGVGPKRSSCNGNQLTQAPDPATGVMRTVFVPQFQPTQIVKEAIHAIVSLPLDYTVAFDIKPGHQIQQDWSSILHFTATGNNCCEYGDRAPGIWSHPTSRKMAIGPRRPGAVKRP